MKQAKLIKKAEQAEPTPLRQQTSSAPQPTLTELTQKMVQQWLDVRQHQRSQNPRAAFAALFVTTA